MNKQIIRDLRSTDFDQIACNIFHCIHASYREKDAKNKTRRHGRMISELYTFVSCLEITSG